MSNVCNSGESILNDTQISQKTKNSAELDFKELNSLINQARDDEKVNISALSNSKADNSISIISNQEIWNINANKEDSREFLEEIERLKQGIRRKKKLSTNSEDYDDEILDENISTVKSEQVQLISNPVDFNQNNLTQIAQLSPRVQSPVSEHKTDYNSPPSNNKKTNSSNETNITKSPIKDEVSQNSCNIFKQIVINGIEKGKYYTPKQNRNISKFDNVIPSNIPIPLTQRDLAFNNNRMQMNYNNINPNIGVSGAFIINNNTNQNTIFQNGNFSRVPMFIPPFVNIPPMKPDTSKEKHQNNQNKNESHKSKNKGGNDTLSKKINIDDIIIGKEKRTTLMLRNIPNKYSLNNIIEEINSSFWGKYDYINLPIDYERKLNLGYAFINFVDPMHIILFYETYRFKKWNKYKSDKKMDMTYADKQGKKDNNSGDEQTYFASEDKRFNFKTLVPKIEIPISYLDFFKKIYPNSVCVVEDKHGIYNDKCFVVKSIGKKQF